jgi:environmental stress-induced protein Ves
MRHLTPVDYTRQPWKNGKGMTVELARADSDYGLLWRLSMATVAEDGPFSLFPGVERNLTVISGPGFRLVGDGLALDCRPFQPVAFAGDVAISAEATRGLPSDDFNVMTARRLPRPHVGVLRGAARLAGDALTGLFALDAGRANDKALARHDLILTDQPLLAEGHFLFVKITGLPA